MYELHAISPGNENPEIVAKKALQIYDVVDFIHLRERHWTVEQFSYVLQKLKYHDPSLAKVIINDRVDLAYVTNINKVHLPSHGFEPKDLRTHFPSITFGCSVHHVQSAKKMEKLGARYMIYGHIFSTPSKKGLAPRGLKKLAQITKAVTTPIIAIGGITPERVPNVLEHGAKGIAVMSGIFKGDEAYKRAIQYRNQLV